MAKTRLEESRQHRKCLASATPMYADPRRARGRHPHQADDEQHRGDEIRELDDRAHCLSSRLLSLNISSMRSVSTQPPTTLPAPSSTAMNAINCSIPVSA